MSDSDRRVFSRTAPPMEVAVHCNDGSVYRGIVTDLSIASIRVEIFTVYTVGRCGNGTLKLQLGTKSAPYIAEVHGEMIRLEGNTVVYKMLNADLNSFQTLKKAILGHASDPESLIREIQHHPELSLNSLYLPAMQEAITGFVQQAVTSVFAIYLDQEISVIPENASEPIVDLSVSGISSFNGALFGSVIMTTCFSYAKQVVATLSETTLKDLDLPLLIDGFGEITNMIAGGVQTGLAEEYENISLIPPTVFIGAQCVYGSEQLFSVKNHFRSTTGTFRVDCLFSII